MWYFARCPQYQVLNWHNSQILVRTFFHIPQCSIQKKNLHISVLTGALWDMEQLHSGISEIGLLSREVPRDFASSHRPFW